MLRGILSVFLTLRRGYESQVDGLQLCCQAVWQWEEESCFGSEQGKGVMFVMGVRQG